MNEGTRRLFTIIAYVSIAIIAVISIYGLVESLYFTGEPVGEVWVNVYFPFPPYFAQPVTWFSVACVALFYSGLRLWEERISKWPNWILMLVQLVGFVIAFSAAYEVLYNFMVWGALYVTACGKGICDPDVLTSQFPSQWSLVFATRVFSAIFVISGYTVYYCRKFSGSGII